MDILSWWTSAKQWFLDLLKDLTEWFLGIWKALAQWMFDGTLRGVATVIEAIPVPS